MNTSLLGNFIVEIKNWIYMWNTTTFALVVIIISLLMAISAGTLIKGFINEKPKFKILPFIYLALLTTMLVLIILARK